MSFVATVIFYCVVWVISHLIADTDIIVEYNVSFVPAYAVLALLFVYT